jgi:leader peptidase (prepilin peptidase)/N-methyltransferase
MTITETGPEKRYRRLVRARQGEGAPAADAREPGTGNQEPVAGALTAETRPRAELDRNVLLVIPALLALVLATLPFLSRELGGDLLTQVFVVLLIVLGGIDLLSLRVPNLILYPSIVFVLAGTAIVDRSLLDSAAIGGLTCLAIMFTLALIARGPMGMGDVKFAALVGCAMGWRLGIASLALGFVFGGVAAVAVLLLRLVLPKERLPRALPTTPFLAAGTLVWVVMAGTLIG